MGLLLIYFGIVLAYFRYNSEAFIFLAILPIIVEVAAFATLIPYSSYLWRKLERQASKESKGEVWLSQVDFMGLYHKAGVAEREPNQQCI